MLTLRAACLLACCLAVLVVPLLAGGVSDKERYSKLQQWAVKNGIVVNYELREVGLNNWGAFAARDLESGEHIVSVPKHMFLNSSYAISVGPLPKREKWAFAFEPLTVTLMMWRSNPVKYFHEPFINALPRSYSHIPLTWPDEYLNLLNGTSIYLNILSTKATLATAFDALKFEYQQNPPTDPNRVISPDVFTLDVYIDCYITVSSRAWGVATPGSDAREILMSPLADMLNHDDTAGLGTDTPTGFEIRTNRRYAKGDEVFTNYGPKSAGEMLQAYGFVPTGRPFPEFVPLRLQRTSDPKTQSLIDSNLKRFNFNVDAIHITGQSMNEAWLNPLRAGMLVDSELDSFHGLLNGRAVSIENELAVCRALTTIIKTMLTAMPGSETEDQERLRNVNLDFRERAALRLRQLERSIMQNQMRAVSKHWDTILLTGVLSGGVPADPLTVSVQK